MYTWKDLMPSLAICKPFPLCAYTYGIIGKIRYVVMTWHKNRIGKSKQYWKLMFGMAKGVGMSL